MSVGRPSGAYLSQSLKRRGPNSWSKCETKRPVAKPPTRDEIHLWTPIPLNCDLGTRPKTVDYLKRRIAILPDRRKKDLSMGDMVKSFFGEDKMPDAGRAAQLLRGYLDDKLKAPERVPRQEKEEFLRVVQHIPPQENPQLERLIDKVTKLFERQTDDVPAPSMYTDEGPGAITPDLPVILPRNNPP